MQINSGNFHTLSSLDRPSERARTAPGQTTDIQPVPASVQRYAQVSLQSLGESGASPRGLSLIKDLEGGIPRSVQVFIKPTIGFSGSSIAWQIAAPPPGGVEHVISGLPKGR